MKKSLFVLLTFLFLLSPSLLSAQKVIRGTVKDAKTGETLPAANIQIEGTYRGTITNDDGKFALKIRELPATLLVSYIGYASTRIPITSASKEEQLILLEPVVIDLGAV
ncbi:MAG: carboxypeptidase-like regulatory domain-containing protein, partial [bacterium]